MNNNKGITLVSLMLYIVLMIIMLNVMSMIITEFYNNTDSIQDNVQEIIEFNKFNNYFIKEIKSNNNKVENYQSNKYILFASGNSFLIENNSIYYNNVKICDNVKSMIITLGKNGDGIDQDIINITLNFNSFNKSISYKVENIY